MKVLVIGPESSGGRFVARWLRQSDGLEVEHYSSPMGGEYADRHWPTDRLDPSEFDRAVVTTRAWYPMIKSQAAHHVTAGEDAAEFLTRLSYVKIHLWLHENGIPWRLCSYESLMIPGTTRMADLFRWFGVDPEPCPEEIINGNIKWEDMP